MSKEMKPYRLLVVEDNPGDYVLLEQYLRMSHLPIENIFHAESIAIVPELLKDNEFDIALLDLSLPDSAGVSSVISLNQLLPKTPIVVLSGMSTIDIAVESISLGAQDYLVKGEFDERLLTKAIQYSIERKKTIERLLEGEETFRRLFNESADSVLLLDDTGFTDCNQSAVSILGYSSREEILNKKPYEISPKKQPDGRLSTEKAEAMIAEALQKGYHRFEWVHTKSDGTEFPVEVMLTSIILRGRQMFYTLWRDITERKKAEEKLKESNELYEFVNKATNDTIWEWDYLTSKGHWGDGIMETFGYSEANLKYNENWVNEFIHPEDKERVIKNVEGHIENGLQNWQDEFRFRCADGSYKHVKDRGFILYNNGGKPYRMIGAMTDITNQVQEEIRINKAIIDAQEQERHFIGAELHDNINQILAGTLLTLGMAKSQQPGTRPANGFIETAMGYINDAINETRKLSHQLAPTALGEISLKDIVENLLMIMNLDNRFTINFKYDETNKALISDDIQLNLYRILQEQIKNIVKYSEAVKIEIAITFSEDAVMMRIFDNGRGFDTTLTKNGIGLGNIKKRAQSLSGKFILNSAPGKGCEIIVEIPLNRRDNGV